MSDGRKIEAKLTGSDFSGLFAGEQRRSEGARILGVGGNACLGSESLAYEFGHDRVMRHNAAGRDEHSVNSIHLYDPARYRGECAAHDVGDRDPGAYLVEHFGGGEDRAKASEGDVVF